MRIRPPWPEYLKKLIAVGYTVASISAALICSRNPHHVETVVHPIFVSFQKAVDYKKRNAIDYRRGLLLRVAAGTILSGASQSRASLGSSPNAVQMGREVQVGLRRKKTATLKRTRSGKNAR